MTTCPKCGSTTKKDSKFCRKCGKSLTEGYWTGIRILGFILIIIALIGLGIIYMSLQEQQEAPSAPVKISSSENKPKAPTQQPQVVVKPKLPSSYCMSLTHNDAKTLCYDMAGAVDDDQRIRDFLVYYATLSSDFDKVDSYRNQANNDGKEWNTADTSSEQKEVYDRYYVSALLYANQLNGTITHLNEYKEFLENNKVYLDSQGVNTQSQINLVTDLKTSQNTNIITMQSNLKMMEEHLELQAQQQQQNEELLNMLLKLAVGLG